MLKNSYRNYKFSYIYIQRLIFAKQLNLLNVYHNRINQSLMKNGSTSASSSASSLLFVKHLNPNRTVDLGNARLLATDNKIQDIEDFRKQEELKDKCTNEFGSASSSSSIHHDSATNGSTNEGQTEEDKKIHEIRTRILDAALQFVNVHGWSREAIASGAESIGYPGVIHGMFPNSGMELIQYFYLKCNQQLIEYINSEFINEDTNKSGSSIDPTVFANKCIRYRLELVQPYLIKWPQAIAIMSLPQNAPTSIAQLLHLIDDICFYAGDKSVDFGWYIRRIGLASIYKMTELYMLQDTSVNYENTWTFLDRRIDDAKLFHAAFSFTDQTTRDIVQIANSTFSTVRNILGINVNR